MRGIDRWLILPAACAALAAGSGGPALAGDAPVDWSGFYGGAHMGGAIGYNDFSNPYGSTLYGDKVHSPGPFAGLQGGYNFQYGMAVLGFEGDMSWANLDGTNTCMQPVHRVPSEPGSFLGGAFGATCRGKAEWF
jgi:hypothetical protein